MLGEEIELEDPEEADDANDGISRFKDSDQDSRIKITPYGVVVNTSSGFQLTRRDARSTMEKVRKQR